VESSLNVVIVGNGIAGITAAKAIKESTPETRVSVFTDENNQYYPRPRLYDVLSGHVKPEDAVMFSEDHYKNSGILIQLNKKASYIDTKNKKLLLDDKTKVSYDKLLLANGAHCFVPPIKGVNKKGVFTLRTINDALAINEFAKKIKKSIIIGGGLLGLEFASALNKLGQQVTVVEMFSRLLPKQLDEKGATLLKKKVESRGIKIVLGAKITEVLGNSKVTAIMLENGKKVYGNLLLFSAGIRSNIGLALESGIKTNRGVIVDNQLRTSVDGIYASGDVAEFEEKVYGIIPAAIEQAKIAATNIIGKEPQRYTGTVVSNTLRVINIELTSIGIVNPEDKKLEEIQEIDKQKGVYKKLVFDQGKIVGAIFLGNRKNVVPIKNLIAQETDITRYKDLLLKEDFDYKKINA
jgi:nitrite reductase (NADH) large subunit